MLKTQQTLCWRTTVLLTTVLPTTVLLTATMLTGCNLGTASPTATTETITLGALLPLSGAWSSYGKASEAAMRAALADVNAFLKDTEATVRFDLRIEDTETDTEIAFQKLGDLSAAGIKVVVGPMTSDALARVQPLARRLGVMLVSPSGAVASLAIENDDVFRLLPDDTNQANAIIAAIKQQNLDAIILFARDGLWADELAATISQRFTDAGGAILDTIRFDQANLANRDFRDELQNLTASVAQSIDDFGTDGVGVCLLSYGEGVQIFKQALGDATLMSLPWFGTDGFAVSAELQSDAEAATFAQATFYTAPMYDGKNVEPDRRELVAGPLTATLERTPDAFAYLTYDSVWLVALAISQTGTATDISTLAQALPPITDVYNGATGRIIFNSAGDRESGTYRYWSLIDSNGTPQWETTQEYTDGVIQ